MRRRGAIVEMQTRPPRRRSCFAWGMSSGGGRWVAGRAENGRVLHLFFPCSPASDMSLSQRFARLSTPSDGTSIVQRGSTKFCSR